MQTHKPVNRINRLTKKIGDSHLVWFRESNSWIQFEEPAWFVYEKLSKGTSFKHVAEVTGKRYHLDDQKSLDFVKDIAKNLYLYSVPKVSDKKSHITGRIKSPLSIHSSHTYKFNDRTVEIQYGSNLLEYMIHPSLEHIEIKASSKPGTRIKVFEHSGQSVLKIANKTWIEKNPNLLKRRLYIELSGIVYQKSDDDWLSIIHGSSIRNEKEGILLTTATGFGKSTLTALMCKNGLRFVSDDYIAVDAKNCKAHPFPAALSVKDGAFPVLAPLYKELGSARQYHFKGTSKTVKYIYYPADTEFYKPVKIKYLVFVKYDPETRNSFREVPFLEAFKRFNDEAWVSTVPANAKKFLKWFERINCFELVYSDNTMAVKSILGIFKQAGES